MKKTALIIGLPILGLLLGACTKPASQSGPSLINEVKQAPPQEVVTETGEIDDQKFVADQDEVAADDSIDTLEQELDDTVILEEDFSDL